MEEITCENMAAEWLEKSLCDKCACVFNNNNTFSIG